MYYRAIDIANDIANESTKGDRHATVYRQVSGADGRWGWSNTSGKIGFCSKDYLDHVKGLSRQVKRESIKAFVEQGRPVLYLRDSSTGKDETARQIAEKDGVENGLVCAIGAVEPSLISFEHRGTYMVRRRRPCQVSFHIQVGMNGREWLARQMDKEGLKYRQSGRPQTDCALNHAWGRQGNCFVRIRGRSNCWSNSCRPARGNF